VNPPSSHQIFLSSDSLQNYQHPPFHINPRSKNTCTLIGSKSNNLLIYEVSLARNCSQHLIRWKKSNLLNLCIGLGSHSVQALWLAEKVPTSRILRKNKCCAVVGRKVTNRSRINSVLWLAEKVPTSLILASGRIPKDLRSGWPRKYQPPKFATASDLWLDLESRPVI
jgi:hypothetical protein